MFGVMHFCVVASATPVLRSARVVGFINKRRLQVHLCVFYPHSETQERQTVSAHCLDMWTQRHPYLSSVSLRVVTRSMYCITAAFT